MKTLNIRLFVMVALVASLTKTYASEFPFPKFLSCLSPTRDITIKEGEPVYLELVSDTNIDDLQAGNVLQFRVNTNVIVDGKEVVRAFTTAIGTVLKVEGSGYNTSPKIQVNIRHIRAVDGQQILVDGPHNLNNLTIGAPLTVYVKNPVKIDVR
jgi:hypothetical protein